LANKSNQIVQIAQNCPNRAEEPN